MLAVDDLDDTAVERAGALAAREQAVHFLAGPGGRGVGRALVDAALTWASDHG